MSGPAGPPREQGRGKDEGLLGVVLAGGGSRRFGRPKAVEPLAGRPMAGWAARALAPHTVRVVVVGHPAVGRALGLEVRPDLRAERGPVEGLRTALRWAEEEGREGVLVLACDLPLVPARLLGSLAAGASGPEQAVVPASPGPLGVEPLCARYAVEAVPAVEAAVDAGVRAAHALLKRLDVRVIPLEELLGAADPATAFLNVNTPAAAERAGMLLRGRGTVPASPGGAPG